MLTSARTHLDRAVDQLKDRVDVLLHGGTPERWRSAWSLVGFAGRALLAAITIIAIARSLGTAGYGVFIGIVAYVGLLAPLASLGVGEVMVKRVSRNTSELRTAWGATLGVTFTFGLLLYVVTIALGSLVLPGRDLGIIALFGAVEFLSTGVMHNNARAYAALDRYPAMAFTHIADSGARAFVALGFWLMGGSDLRSLAFAMMISMAVTATVASLTLARVQGKPRLRADQLMPAGREGSKFALGDAAQTVQTNVDKTMLLSAGFDTDAGLYGAGVRLIQYSMLPANSIFAAAYPEFFRRGESGIESAHRYSRELRKRVVTVTIVGAIVAILFSPIAGFILGDEFDGVVPVVLAMALYPLVRGLEINAADVLSGSGRQAYRSKAQLATAVLNVALNIALIPSYSWKGAVAATYLSELAFLALLVWGVHKGRKQERNNAASAGLEETVEATQGSPDVG